MRYLALALLVGCGGNPSTPIDAAPIFDGPAPEHLAALPLAVDFGTVPVATQSPPTTVTISNTGGVTGTGLAITAGAGFVLGTTTCGATLNAQDSCAIEVVAAPQVLGVLSGTLHITDDSTAVVDVSLIAAVTTNENGELLIAPNLYAFSDTAVGQTSAAATFTLSNPGATPIAGITVTAGGQDPTQFILASNTCSTLAASETCTFTVAFAPTSSGPMDAVFSGVSSMGSTVSAAVTGTGLATPSTTSHDLGPPRSR